MVQQCDQAAEGWVTGSKAFGAIDRVDHPRPRAMALGRWILFPTNPVIRVVFCNQVAQHLLDFSIGNGDGCIVELSFDNL